MSDKPRMTFEELLLQSSTNEAEILETVAAQFGAEAAGSAAAVCSIARRQAGLVAMFCGVMAPVPEHIRAQVLDVAAETLRETTGLTTALAILTAPGLSHERGRELGELIGRAAVRVIAESVTAMAASAKEAGGA